MFFPNSFTPGSSIQRPKGDNWPVNDNVKVISGLAPAYTGGNVKLGAM